jgi:peptide/nickel transport system substrate-binding protein
VVARSTDAVSLDPGAPPSDIESLEVGRAGLRPAWSLSAAGRLEPEADLATSWTVSSDGTIWTFELRPNVRFHDGTPFDADAVVFSFERQIVSEHPAHEADFVWTRAYHNIRHVRAAAPLRVQFEIDRPYAPFLANLAMGPAAIVSPTAVRKWKRDFGRHPVGTGPYRFVEWIPGDRITLERNPEYWDERAHTRYLGVDRDGRLAPAPAGAGIGCRRRDPAAGARRPAAGPASTRPRPGDGARDAGLVHGDEHPAPAAQRSAASAAPSRTR